MASTDTKTPAPAEAKKPEPRVHHGDPTHIRFVGNPSDDENSSTSVFGKVFYRGKWVPLDNLNGGNPDKRALEPAMLDKLVKNPAFQLGHGEDIPIPGVLVRTDDENVEEA